MKFLILLITVLSFQLNASANQFLPPPTDVDFTAYTSLSDFEIFCSQNEIEIANLNCAEEAWNQASDGAAQYSRNTGTLMEPNVLHALTEFLYDNCVNGVHGSLHFAGGAFFFIEN